jgi:pyrrolidone-carboxylate peptidase
VARLLLYGFGPYRQFKENITEKILKRLPAKSGVKKIVFPVWFQKRQFIEALKRHKPEVILGLGVCPIIQKTSFFGGHRTPT